MRTIRALIFFAIALVCTVAHATTYYVSTTGSDSNNCLTSGAPCLTLAHAESLSSTGDTFSLAAGLYRLTSGTSGTYTSTGGQISAKNNQTFTGPACTPTSGQCSAILSGSVQLTSGQILGPDSFGNYYATGFTQQGGNGGYSCDPSGGDGGNGWPGCNFPEDLYVNGAVYQHMDFSTEATLDAGTWWFNYTTDTIYLPSGLTPSYIGSNTVEIGVLRTVFASNGANNVTVENLTVEEFAAQLQQGGGIDPNYGTGSVSTAATGWTVQNCYLTLNHSNGVRIAFGITVLNNVMTLNGQFGIGGGTPAGNIPVTASGVVIQGNTVTYNNYAHVAPGFGAGGIKFGNTADAVVRGNTVTNNTGNGIHFDVNSWGPLVDGNVVNSNTDPDAPACCSDIIFEISEGGATYRNNIIGFQGTGGGTVGLYSSSSQGVQAYCNEITQVSGNNQVWSITAADRGDNTVAPNLGSYIVSTGNWFHHNTIIWSSGATGLVGYHQTDTANQPNFFTNNTPPDYNTYHGPSTSVLQFIYDNNNSGSNTAINFSTFQSNGADVHGTFDTVYNSGYPTVSITSPADQSSVANPVTISSSASDTSGIAKVEFYVDWALQATVTSGPYNYSWAGAGGTHVVAAMAYSNAGVRLCNAVTLTQASPITPPGTTITGSGQVIMKGNVIIK